jgi:hypothetical protein
MLGTPAGTAVSSGRACMSSMTSPPPAVAPAAQCSSVGAQERCTFSTAAAGNPFARPRSDAAAAPKVAYNAAPREYGVVVHEASLEEKTVDLTGDDDVM